MSYSFSKEQLDNIFKDMSFVEKLFSDSSLAYSDIKKQEAETKETLLKKYSNK